MSLYKDIRSQPWFSKLYKEEYAYGEYPHQNPASDQLIDKDHLINQDHLNTAVIDWIIEMEGSSYRDLFMLQSIKEEFGEWSDSGWSISWSKDLFNSCDLRIRKAMKNFLRSRGVYLSMSDRTPVTEQFFHLLSLDDCPQWPEEELRIAMLDPNLICRQTIGRARPKASPRSPEREQPRAVNDRDTGVQLTVENDHEDDDEQLCADNDRDTGEQLTIKNADDEQTANKDRDEQNLIADAGSTHNAHLAHPAEPPAIAPPKEETPRALHTAIAIAGTSRTAIALAEIAEETPRVTLINKVMGSAIALAGTSRTAISLADLAGALRSAIELARALDTAIVLAGASCTATALAGIAEALRTAISLMDLAGASRTAIELAGAPRTGIG